MILNSCEHGDSIIVYAGTLCPMCELEDENAELADSLSTLEDRFVALENDYNKLEEGLYESKSN